MQIGIKLWPKRFGYQKLDILLSNFDFVELPLDELDGSSSVFSKNAVFHFPHTSSFARVNISNPNDREKAAFWFNKLLRTKAKECVIHPDLTECGRAIAMETLKSNLRHFLKNSGIVFYLENMPSEKYLCHEAGEMGELLAADGRLKTCLDMEHLYQASKNDEGRMETFFEELKDKIAHAHASDALGNKGHLPIGEGEMDFGFFSMHLGATRCKRITLEVLSDNPDVLLFSKKKIMAIFG